MKPPIKIQLDDVIKISTPTPIPLTDSPRTKQPKKIPLKSSNHYGIYDIDADDQLYVNNENTKQNNTTSIQKLESDKTN